MNIRANGIKQSCRKLILRIVAFVTISFPLAVLAAPSVLYTDINSGPNTGGENNNGSYLTIFGKGFGSSGLGTSVKVYVGNGEVACYMYLGPSLGRPDVQEIGVQLGPNTATGAVKVTVNGVASNTDQTFTVRPGNFYFISPSGNDSTGAKNDITHPYRSANTVVNLSSFQAGDFIIALPGTYTLSQTDAPNNSDSWLRATKSGTTSAPVAFLGYPGHQTLVRHSQGIRIISNYVSIANWVVGNFAITLTDCDGSHAGEIVDIGPTSSPQVCSDTAGTMSGTATNIKLVNMEADGNDTGGLCSGGDGLIEIQHSKGVKIIGVSLHNTSPAQGDNESAHPIYLSASQSGTEVGWNAVYNIPATRGVIQAHTDSFGGSCWGAKQITDIKIHDNVQHDLAGQAILLDGGTGDIQLYNNIIYNHKDHRYSDVISLRGNGGQLNASLYNNTIYANADVSGTGFLIGIGGDNGGMPKHVTLYNNIFYLTDSRDAWYGGDWTNPQSWINAGNLTSANNLWYGSSSGKPSFAGSTELNVDPLFVDTSVGNLRLTSPTSPAIDRGTSLTNTVVAIDLDGNARPQGSAPDIGAYEASGATLPAPQNVKLQKNSSSGMTKTETDYRGRLRMQKTNIFRGMEILMLVAALGLTACGGGGGGSTGSTSPSSTTSGGTGSGGGGGTPASSTYTLSWDAVTGASVTGYRVYYGTAPLTSQSPLGTVDTTVTSVDFSPGQYKIAAGTTLYMAVSSLGTNGVESPISKTVSVVVQ